MRERYQPLPNEQTVFRTVKRGGGFLPPGHKLPKPDWLEPTKEDQKEAEKAGRSPGLSMWDAEYTTFNQACTWRRTPETEQLAFATTVESILLVGTTHKRNLGVVADPLDLDAPEHKTILAQLRNDVLQQQQQSAQGHSLAEGIRKPSGANTRAHREFRAELASKFEPFVPPSPREDA